jgi:uncharacterized protein YhjY with autotransporter beta-barrel domain
MKTDIRCFTGSSPSVIVVILALVTLSGVHRVQASPDPATSIIGGIALFQGNQSNGIAGGLDFSSAAVTTLNVNSLSDSIHPSNAVAGIRFERTGAGNVTVNAGLSVSNIVIQTRNAAGIAAASVGSPPLFPPVDPFLGIPIPSTNAAVPGGVVNVQSHSDITTEGNSAYGIKATSQTTGYSPLVILELLGYTGAGITFTMIGATNADGTPATLGQTVTGTLVDTNGHALPGNGGTFVLNANGSYSFNAGTNFNNLAVGESVQTVVNFTVQGVNGTHITNVSSGTLVANVKMTTNGLVINPGSYFNAFGPSTFTNSWKPDLANFGRTQAGIAAAGGDGNGVTVNNQGNIKTYGTNSYGIFAQSLGGNGGPGSDGSISHSSGKGGRGSSGGDVTVNVDGTITTVSNGSAGVVAWSRGGNGGPGGYGGAWRYGGPGGDGGNGGEVRVNGSGTITTAGEFASGIIAVSAGGDGNNGGDSWDVVTGGGNGGAGGHGGNVIVDGDWNITTSNNYAHGIWAKSVGGNAGTGGSGGWIAGHPGGGGIATDGGTVSVVNGGRIETFGHYSYGIYAESIGGFGGAGGSQDGIFYSCGGSGDSAGSGGAVSVTQEATGQIITHGTNAYGILAQSVGGGGGSGGGGGAIAGYGGSSGHGGLGGMVTVTNYGQIWTYGESAKGIYAQSVGGGGGDGGSGAGIAGFGGEGGNTSPGGPVAVANFGSITTTGALADAIFAQSVGGGGGSAGTGKGIGGVGGTGNSGGSGSNVVVVNAGLLQTYGAGARGIFAQSVGGGGGDGASGSGLVGVGGNGSVTSPGGNVNVINSGTIVSRAQSIFAQSIGGGGGNGGASSGWFSFGGNGGGGGNGGTVTVNNSGNLATFDDTASAIFAQSVGGGGGSGGNSVAVGPFVSVAIGGNGAKGGNGGEVSVSSGTNTILTTGNNSYGIFAQSVGGGGGAGGFACSGSLGKGFSAAVGLGGTGGDGGAASNVVVNSQSAITTYGTNAHGLFAQSVGGGGGSGGFSIAVSGSDGLSLSLSIGGAGGKGGNGEAVTVTSSNLIQTYGARSYGILAQSVGGGGGDGGFSISAAGSLGGVAVPLSFGGANGVGGGGGTVYLNSQSDIITYTNDSHGILAQSVGGGGGSGGFSIAGSVSSGGSLGLSFGASGGAGGAGSDVTAGNTGNITTYGDRSDGILVQSVGGGGGNGGFSVAGSISTAPAASFSMGGSGGGGGNSGNVSLNNSGSITTYGNDSHGIFVQSLAGGGGSGGFSVAGSISFNSGALGASIGGDGSGGGDAGDVVVTNTGAFINTAGTHAYGLLAQSIGGSGGDGGFSVAGSISKGPSATLSIGGSGGRAGAGGDVLVFNSSSITTLSNDSHALFAQSVGGGGGSGGFSVAGSISASSGAVGASIGGAGEGGGNAGTVNVANTGDITATVGDRSYGVLAQSIGGGGGDGGFSVAGTLSKAASVGFSLGRSGGGGGAGSNVFLSSSGSVYTFGSGSHALFAQSLGGGGGAGGFSVAGGISQAPSVNCSIGGSGGSGGNGGDVTLVSTGPTNYTGGDRAYGVFAQSVGGGGGDGGFSVAGGITKEAAVSFSMGGNGSGGGIGARVFVTNTSTVITEGELSHGILAQSIGGGGGAGGFSAAGSLALSEQSKQISVSIGGDGGGGGAASNVVVFNSGSITTFGERANGIFAQSVGGGGGDGGEAKVLNKSLGMVFTNSGSAGTNNDKGWSLSIAIGAGGEGGSAGKGGTVMVTNSGSIYTGGSNAIGILAQSVGGGGGSGGLSATEAGGGGGKTSISLQFGLGGAGGGGGAGDLVTVANRGSITTMGDASHGILAQSVGGGGGLGGASTATKESPDSGNSIYVSAVIGGKGGLGGNGSDVMVLQDGDITTSGESAYGILAQSVGGGGGAGGNAKIETSKDTNSFSLPGSSTNKVAAASTNQNWSVDLSFGLGGSGGVGGSAGQVAVFNRGNLTTYGTNSIAIFAQSVGGGGGAGGMSEVGGVGGNGNTNLSIGVSLGLSMGGSGSGGGSGNLVTVSNSGTIVTVGDAAHGIFAQSVGGGGGAGGASSLSKASQESGSSVTLSAAIGGSAAGGGNGSNVMVLQDGNITTYGEGAYGIFAQSVGGGGGMGGTAKIGVEQDTNSSAPSAQALAVMADSPTNSASTNSNDKEWNVDISFGLGGKGGGGGQGGQVMVINRGNITTYGTNSIAIFAQSVGGGGGAGGMSEIDGRDTSGKTNLSLTVSLGGSVGGSGGGGGNGDMVTVSNSGTIMTAGDAAHGIFAQSVGGGGGLGGASSLSKAPAGSGNSVTLSAAIGGSGGNGGNGSDVMVLQDGNITTYGEGAYGILAQSVGGGGGMGGTAKIETKADAKSDTNSAAQPALALAVMADSPTNSASTNGNDKEWSVDLSFGLGGSGGNGGSGGQVMVVNRGNVTTYGANSVGIFAQSVGGGGGAGGMSDIEGLGHNGNTNLSLSINLGGSVGGSGGLGAMGNLVAVTNSGTIITVGDAAHGIFAQSVGGGGGLGGASAISKSTPESGSTVTLTAAIGGSGGTGGNSSNVMVLQSGDITTYGEGSYGILAQSVGGGGGMGGTAKIEAKSDAAADTNSAAQPAFALAAVADSPTNSASTNSNDKEWSVDLSFGLGGGGGSAGNGGQVTVDNRGSVTTYGANSVAIFAQSVGGGGGAGGMSQIENTDHGQSTNLSLNINLGGGLGGSGGAGGNGDMVRVTSEGVILTVGDAAHGIVAQSIGGGGGAGGASAATTAAGGDKAISVNATIGGAGGSAGNGGQVTVDNSGQIDTWGDGAYGILAQSVGGGGGAGGTAKIESKSADTNAAPSFASQDSGTNSSSWSVNLGIGAGGAAAGGGSGGAVGVNNSGSITTRGNNALGIFAQSVGGGGGAGGMSSVDNGGGDANTAVELGVSLGGSGGTGGSADAVSVTNTGTIITLGNSSHAVFAQSVGGGGGMGGDSVTTSAAAGTNTHRSVNLSLSLGGSGSLGGSAGAVNVFQNGQVYTAGANAYGILAQSIGGGGGAGGTSVSTPDGGNGNLLQLTVGIGGKGGPGGHADVVNVLSSGGITTYGDGSYAILAQSIGGGGGVGGDTITTAGSGSSFDLSVGIGGAGGAGNYGGSVTVSNSGGLYTYGNNALGILAQSIGGGGGRGGSATGQGNLTGAGNTFDLNVSVGGNGAGASDGGIVSVDNAGNVVTFGIASHGILAQSIGGGGGDGGYGGQDASSNSLAGTDLQIVVGGRGGSSGNGLNVTVRDSGYIVTFGAGAFGVLAQSVGGGGGIGGYGQSGSLANLAIGGGGGAGGNGGDVNVEVTGGIETFGDGAYGVFAQSVGGGGGIAGNVNHGMSTRGLAVNLGQDGGAGGNGSNVTVISAGDIITHGAGACGIFAQSVGGGGGLAGDLGNGLSFAGSVGGTGSAGDVRIIHTGNITTYGEGAYGIFAQSAGGTDFGGSVQIDYIGSINVYGSNASAVFVQSRGNQGAENLTLTVRNGVFEGGSGDSAGVWFADGGNNTLYNFNTITTLNGVAGNAIIGGTGNETINNDGTVIGSVNLGGGLNQFNNYAGGRVNAGAILYLGAGNRFLNDGILAPGGSHVLETTALTGNFLQFNDGTLEFELGPRAVYDRLAISGTAELAGTVSAALYGGFVPVKGDQFTVLTAASGVTGEFTNLVDPLQGKYALHLGTIYGPTQINLITLQDSFVPFALTHNQRAVARNLDSFSGFQGDQLQGDQRETNLVAFLNAIPGAELPADFDLIAPEELGALFNMNLSAVNSMVGNVQRRMNEIRTGTPSTPEGLSRFEPRGPVMQLASADRTLPLLPKAGPDEQWGGFMTGYGQYVDVNGDGNGPGYSYYNAGFTLGLDKEVNHCLVGGFTVDYADGQASLVNGGSADMEGLRGGFYGCWFSTNAYVEAQLGMGTYRYNSEREALGGTAKGDTAGLEVDTMLGSGYNLKYGDFIPGILGELHYTHVEINGFTETGSLSPLHVMDNDSDSFWSLLGTRFAYEWQLDKTTLLPELRLGWRHEFLDDNQTIGARMASGAGGVFEVQSPSLGRDSLSLVAGVSTRCARNVSVGVYYDGELAGENNSSHAVSGGISVDF